MNIKGFNGASGARIGIDIIENGRRFQIIPFIAFFEIHNNGMFFKMYDIHHLYRTVYLLNLTIQKMNNYL